MSYTIPKDSQFTIREKVIDIEDVTIRCALLKALEDAQAKRQAAGLQGSTSDGGASSIEMCVTAYSNGWRRMIPQWLEEYVKQVENEADPDYEKYLELREKFQGIARASQQDFTKLPQNKTKNPADFQGSDLLRDF